jgi:tetratricopeptide (TPR) repeat protein
MDFFPFYLQVRFAVSPLPTTSAAYYSNLGHVLLLSGDYARDVTALEHAVELTRGKEPHLLAALADAYSKAGRFAEAIQTATRALDLTLQTHDDKLQKRLRDDIERYASARARAKP